MITKLPQTILTNDIGTKSRFDLSDDDATRNKFNQRLTGNATRNEVAVTSFSKFIPHGAWDDKFEMSTIRFGPRNIGGNHVGITQLEQVGRHLTYTTNQRDFPMLALVSLLTIVPVIVYYGYKVFREYKKRGLGQQATEQLRQERIAQAAAARAVLAAAEDEERQNARTRREREANLTEEERQERRRQKEEEKVRRRAHVIHTLKPCTQVVAAEDFVTDDDNQRKIRVSIETLARKSTLDASSIVHEGAPPKHDPDSACIAVTENMAASEDDCSCCNKEEMKSKVTEVEEKEGSEKKCAEARLVDSFCSICLDEYLAGDTINWSVNRQCQHIYHHDCIMKWLVKNKNDCPCCRLNFIEAEDIEAPSVP